MGELWNLCISAQENFKIEKGTSFWGVNDALRWSREDGLSARRTIRTAEIFCRWALAVHAMQRWCCAVTVWQNNARNAGVWTLSLHDHILWHK
jgi:hypothetical protein